MLRSNLRAHNLCGVSSDFLCISVVDPHFANLDPNETFRKIIIKNTYPVIGIPQINVLELDTGFYKLNVRVK